MPVQVRLCCVAFGGRKEGRVSRIVRRSRAALARARGVDFCFEGRLSWCVGGRDSHYKAHQTSNATTQKCDHQLRRPRSQQRD